MLDVPAGGKSPTANPARIRVLRRASRPKDPCALFPESGNRYYHQIEPRPHYIIMLPWVVFITRSKATGAGPKEETSRSCRRTTHAAWFSLPSISLGFLPRRRANWPCPASSFWPTASESTRDGVSSRTPRNSQKTKGRAHIYPRRFRSRFRAPCPHRRERQFLDWRLSRPGFSAARNVSATARRGRDGPGGWQSSLRPRRKPLA
jgi:hypothetical protein